MKGRYWHRDAGPVGLSDLLSITNFRTNEPDRYVIASDATEKEIAVKTTMTSSIRFFAVALLGSGLLLAGSLGCDKVTNAAASAPVKPVAKVDSASSDVLDGQKWYNQSCASCHGFGGQGMPRQGPSLRANSFVANHADDALVGFIKVGRAANDPASVMKLQMPPKGTNPGLTDAQLKQIVAFIRQVQKEASADQTASLGL